MKIIWGFLSLFPAFLICMMQTSPNDAGSNFSKWQNVIGSTFIRQPFSPLIKWLLITFFVILAIYFFMAPYLAAKNRKALEKRKFLAAKCQALSKKITEFVSDSIANTPSYLSSAKEITSYEAFNERADISSRYWKSRVAKATQRFDGEVQLLVTELRRNGHKADQNLNWHFRQAEWHQDIAATLRVYAYNLLNHIEITNPYDEHQKNLKTNSNAPN